MGFIEESPRHRFYNAALWAEGGRVMHVHRKVYLPTYGLFDEQRYFAAGERFLAFDTARFGRVGILVCEDFWHLSAAAIMQAEEVDLLVCVANSPARGVDGPKIRTAETYEQFAKTFAQLIGAVVIVVNRVGFEDGLCFWGGSMAVGPDGRTIAQAPMLDPSLCDRRVRSGRAAPAAADYPAGPRRAAVGHRRGVQPDSEEKISIVVCKTFDKICANAFILKQRFRASTTRFGPIPSRWRECTGLVGGGKSSPTSMNFSQASGRCRIEPWKRRDHARTSIAARWPGIPPGSRTKIEEIARTYVARLVMPNDPAGDAMHLALASFHRIEVLLTWNCQHLANPNKMEHIQVVNFAMGLPVPLVTTPLNYFSGGEDDV